MDTLDLDQIWKTARTLMDRWSLEDWGLYLSAHRSNYGSCYHHRKTIALSAVILPTVEPSEVIDTILHEIAHALVGSGVQDHGIEWKRMAVKVGATPRAQGPTWVDPEPKWLGLCRHGKSHKRERLTKRLACSCDGPTWKAENLIDWFKNPVRLASDSMVAREIGRFK
mgnify:FL=1